MTLEELVRLDLQSPGQCHQHDQRRVCNAGFYAAEVGAEDAATLGKNFLGELAFKSQIAHPLTDNLFVV